MIVTLPVVDRACTLVPSDHTIPAVLAAITVVQVGAAMLVEVLN